MKKIDEILAHEVGVLGNLLVQHLLLELVHFCGRKGIAEAANLVEDDTECPNIRCWAVLGSLPELRCQVEGRSDLTCVLNMNFGPHSTFLLFK